MVWQLKMKKTLIALTGAMGCGKSVASAAFAELGVRVLDADKLAHRARDEDGRVRECLMEIVGPCAYRDGRADRTAIARAVFSDKAKLERLEECVHPAVERLWLKESENEALCLVEVPLLFEKKLEGGFDLCIDVFCSEQLRRRRLLDRGMSAEEILRRDALQMSPFKKAELADVVLLNESTTDFLKQQARLVISRLKE